MFLYEYVKNLPNLEVLIHNRLAQCHAKSEGAEEGLGETQKNSGPPGIFF